MFSIRRRDNRAVSATGNPARIVTCGRHRDVSRHVNTKKLRFLYAGKGEKEFLLSRVLSAKHPNKKLVCDRDQIGFFIAAGIAQVRYPAQGRRTRKATGICLKRFASALKDLLMAAGRYIQDCTNRRIDSMTVCHGSRETACAALCGDLQFRGRHLTAPHDRLRPGILRTDKFDARTTKSALQHIVAHETRKTAGIQTRRHRVGIVARDSTIPRDRTHHKSRKAAGIVFAA